MIQRTRVLLSSIVSILVITGVVLIYVTGQKEASVVLDSESLGVTSSIQTPPPAPAELSEPPPAIVPQPERLIEDILAESGEEPGAVYYMSRVREALREGNPEFARELLRQMKEEHTSSVLVEEAEALFTEEKAES